MRSRSARLFAASALAALIVAPFGARADDRLSSPLGEPKAEAPAKDAEPPAAKAKSDADIREDLYARLAASTDADETEALVRLLLGAYGQSGSDTADLLLSRAHTAIDRKEYDAAGQLLDAAVAIAPDWAEGWNARATLRYLDDDTDGSMADIAETLKREPRHLGALIGMAMIFEAHDMNENALKAYERALAIAPRWRKAADAATRLKAKIAGQEL